MKFEEWDRKNPRSIHSNLYKHREVDTKDGAVVHLCIYSEDEVLEDESKGTGFTVTAYFKSGRETYKPLSQKVTQHFIGGESDSRLKALKYFGTLSGVITSNRVGDLRNLTEFR